MRREAVFPSCGGWRGRRDNTAPRGHRQAIPGRRGIGVDYAQGRHIGAVAPASELDLNELPGPVFKDGTAPDR